MSVLAELLAAARERAASLPPVADTEPGERGRLERALRGRERLSVIAEVKRSSPSAGALRPDADAVAQARAYVAGGAAAISVLTEPTRFGGTLEDLAAVAAAVPVPVLMKDFVVDERQLAAGAARGAAAALLIVRALEQPRLEALLVAAGELGLDALVEAHDAAEVARALAAGARIVGVNNRDLDRLDVDRARALALLPSLPEEVVAVAESGYARGPDADPVRGLADALLVGGALMTCADPAARIAELRG